MDEQILTPTKRGQETFDLEGPKCLPPPPLAHEFIHIHIHIHTSYLIILYTLTCRNNIIEYVIEYLIA